ncbi:Cytoplasmic glyoxalase II [Coemansia sp. RSA 376]|nr:Cytoplasmic glyoxalase II [Coemansia sp. S680]KAJ2040643.1 Cytoplasmic glyoxalase II [Coemansia sp. S3946]KAJ2049853.1 Cytoplasmic glyoxalase II [Coemansia sp. S16]KAJ2259441.1 Cytoplasmic glyoxalase II [Coemansia sp. RSA 376]
MKVIPVPCLSDNYAYVLVDEDANQVIAIDPVEPKKVMAVIKDTKMTFNTVLTTHHHMDHSGGNNQITTMVPGLKVYGGDSRIPQMTHQLKDGEEFTLGSLRVRAIQTFGHTTSSICYYIRSKKERIVFTGDTLFVGGCGRLFEGTPEDMYESLIGKLAKLPGDTEVYAGHEYTNSNLRFARSVDPDNLKLKQKAERCAELSYTMPSTIADELATNPFMRVDQPALQIASSKTNPIEVLGEIRRMKDNF